MRNQPGWAILGTQSQRASQRRPVDRRTGLFPLNREADRYWGESSHQGWRLTTTDALLAATAVAEEAILITADARNLPIEDLQVLEHL